MRSAPSFGIRGRRNLENVGVRNTARTYGKARIGTYAEKAGGHITVDSEPERLVSHILSIDPRVRSFQQQPFTVDLTNKQLLFTREEISEARKIRGSRSGEVEYTPDFASVQSDGLLHVYEVKLEGYEGGEEYWAKIKLAQEIMAAYCYSFSTVVVPADERHPVIFNAQLLKSAVVRAPQYLTPDIIARVERYCESGSVLLRTLCADLQISTNLIPLLLVTGVLRADLVHHPICASLVLSAGYGDLSHLYLIEELSL